MITLKKLNLEMNSEMENLGKSELSKIYGGNEETTLPPITEPRDATYVTTPFIPMTTLRKK